MSAFCLSTGCCLDPVTFWMQSSKMRKVGVVMRAPISQALGRYLRGNIVQYEPEHVVLNEEGVRRRLQHEHLSK